jgi:hypothetical protein
MSRFGESDYRNYAMDSIMDFIKEKIEEEVPLIQITEGLLELHSMAVTELIYAANDE